jgi:hypothetical protein
VSVVLVPKAKMPSRNQPAGPHSKLKVKGMANKAIFDPQARQQAWLSFALFGLAWRANAHA